MDIESEEDLNNLITNSVCEDTNIDYKLPVFSNKNFNKELAKDVSAMANSDGGNTVYGIEEKDHFPKKIVWIEKDEGYIEKIAQIISSKIFDKIEGVKIKKILSDDKKRFVIVVSIPKSENPPHQVHRDSNQRRYYKRNGSTTREMEHYEIKSSFFTHQKPILEIGFRDISETRDKPAFEIYLENIGKVVADQTYIKLMIPSEYRINGWEKTKDYPQGFSSYEHTLKDTLLYPRLRCAIGTIYHPQKLEFGGLKINFLMVCRDMEILEGGLYIDCEGKMEVNYEASKTRPYTLRIDQVIFNDNPFLKKH